MILVAISMASCSGRPTRTLTVVPVGPDRVASPTLAELASDAQIAGAIEGHVVDVEALRWHEGSARYPYCLVQIGVDRGWKTTFESQVGVRVIGGIAGDRKYVTAFQPDPTALTKGMRVLVFVSNASSVDPGIVARTVEAFYFIDGDRLLNFDRSPAEMTVGDAERLLSRASRGR